MGIFEDCRRVSCPKCHVREGEGCIMLTGRYAGLQCVSAHNERLRAYKSLRDADQLLSRPL